MEEGTKENGGMEERKMGRAGGTEETGDKGGGRNGRGWSREQWKHMCGLNSHKKPEGLIFKT